MMMMMRLVLMLSMLLLCLMAHYSSVADAIQVALINATIYTVDESNPWAEALLMNDEGILTAVGTTNDILENITNDTTASIVDLQGQLLLPGFQDAHLHAVEAGINAALCYIDEDASMNDVPLYFQDCQDGGKFADQGWIVGAGMDVGLLLEQMESSFDEYPITVLDRAYPSTPVLILDNLGHGAVANTVAMQAVGYDTLLTDPPGGIIVRDFETNQQLTGIVLENAQQPLRDAAFPPTEANQEIAYTSLLDALVLLAQHGITTVSDAGGFWRQAQTESWARAEQNGVLTVRASNALYVYPDQDLDSQLPDLTSRFANDMNSLVRFNQAKIYVDGILDLLTAAVYEPYESWLQVPDEDELGFEYFGDRDNLLNISKTLVDAGFQLHFHVTGDRGAGLALDAIEFVANSSGNSAASPHRLTHCYLVNETDRGRFLDLNVVADFQLAPSSVDASYTEFIANLIGTTRASQMLPALELYEDGALLTFSSDWDADILSPLIKIQTVLTRPDGRVFPSVESVIPMLTLNPAILLQHDSKTGSIQVGKAADLVLLDKNIFEVPHGDIGSAQVLLTMLQGEAVYDPTGILGEPIGSAPPAPTTALTSNSLSKAAAHWLGLVLSLGLMLQLCTR